MHTDGSILMHRNSLDIAIPAAPAPFITTFKSEIFLPKILQLLIIPANATIAVPCWSS